MRFSPEHARELPYYKIKESFRDVSGRVHIRLMLTPGYMPDFSTDGIVQVRIGLSYLWQESAVIPGERRLFDADPRAGFSEKVCRCIERLWKGMKGKGSIDAARVSYDGSLRKSRRLVDVSTIRHRDCRGIGAENVCLQAIRELQPDTFLHHEGRTQRRIDATLAGLTVRTVYPCSEWDSLRIHQESPAAKELLTGQAGDTPTQREVYGAAPSLHALKEKLERHPCNRTDTLFNLTNWVMLFDLTNFYFEGRKKAGVKAKFGRNKGKRSDCRLPVPARPSTPRAHTLQPDSVRQHRRSGLSARYDRQNNRQESGDPESGRESNGSHGCGNRYRREPQAVSYTHLTLPTTPYV